MLLLTWPCADVVVPAAAAAAADADGCCCGGGACVGGVGWPKLAKDGLESRWSRHAEAKQETPAFVTNVDTTLSRRGVGVGEWEGVPTG